MQYVDLHIHSTFSDGTLTPGEIVRAARGGRRRRAFRYRPRRRGRLAAGRAPGARGRLRYVRGVEIDSLWEGRDVHVLCYGADFACPRLMDVVREARLRMDEMSDTLLARMSPDFPALDAAEYAAFERDVSLGGWKLLHYLMAKGITRAMTDGMRLYARYGVTYAQAGFRPTGEVIAAIHAAGGRAVLAHPGVTLAGEGNFPLRPCAPGRRGRGRAWSATTRATAARVEQICLGLCARRGLLVPPAAIATALFKARISGRQRRPWTRYRLNCWARRDTIELGTA